MNSQFHKSGYRVYGAGKIYHGSYDRGGEWTDYFDGKGGALTPHPSAPDKGVGGIEFYPLANKNEEMPDHLVVDWCIERMKEEGRSTLLHRLRPRETAHALQRAEGVV